MSVEWTPECRGVLRSAQALSKQLGHHEIVTLYHVFCALLPVLHAMEMEHITAVAATDFPPWDDGAVYISRGGQTPRLKRALEHAILTAQADERPVTPRDIWNGLPHGDSETVAHLLGLFGIDS